MNFWTIFYAIATFQGFFVSIVLFFLKKGNQTGNRLLSGLFFLLSLYLFDNFLGMLNFFDSNPHFLYIVVPIWLLFAPLGYFYIQYQTKLEVTFKWYSFVHLIPFILMLIRFAPFYLLDSYSKLQYFTGAVKPPGNEFILIFFVMMQSTQLLIYSGLIIFKTLKENIETSIHPAHISWLKMVFWSLFIFSSIEFVIHIKWLITRQITLPFNLIPLAVFSFIIYSIAYLAIVQPESIFILNGYKKKKQNGQNLKEYALKLKHIMQSEKPYLSSDLKYSELASQIGISARILTETLRSEIGQSFYDFVNSYRVKEVQDRINSNQMENMTLLAISLDAGFNSKSSFNRIFKKHTGLTPSEYIKQLNSPEHSQTN